MNKVLDENLVQIIILDISGVYAQIHNQGWFDRRDVIGIKQQYKDTTHWRVIEL